MPPLIESPSPKMDFFNPFSFTGKDQPHSPKLSKSQQKLQIQSTVTSRNLSQERPPIDKGKCGACQSSRLLCKCHVTQQQNARLSMKLKRLARTQFNSPRKRQRCFRSSFQQRFHETKPRLQHGSSSSMKNGTPVQGQNTDNSNRPIDVAQVRTARVNR